MTTTTPTRPTHRVYAVSKKPEAEKGHWTEIGAAWPHKDGKGFNLKPKRNACSSSPMAAARRP